MANGGVRGAGSFERGRVHAKLLAGTPKWVRYSTCERLSLDFLAQVPLTYYRSGQEPAPCTVAPACLAWDVEQDETA